MTFEHACSILIVPKLLWDKSFGHFEEELNVFYCNIYTKGWFIQLRKPLQIYEEHRYTRAIPYWTRLQTEDSISLYLSISISRYIPSLCRILALFVKQNKNIKGIFVHKKEHKFPNMPITRRLPLMVHLTLYSLPF